MLKIAIENGYTKKYKGVDTYGARLFMQNFFHMHDLDLVRVSINTFDAKKNRFNEYNILDDTGMNITIKKKYIPDIIWSRRGMAINHKYDICKNFMIVPSKKISIIGNEKFENYKYTQKYQPFTALLSSFFSSKTIQNTYTKNIVIKPIRANGGKGIVLTTVSELLKKRKKYHGMEELFIVQQFKDFSGGYQGICDTNHDVRCMFAGKKIIEITLRIPKKGDFRSNIGSGGIQATLKKSQISKDLLHLSKEIYKDLNLQDNDIFSMDFAYCKPEKRRYLIEINASPGTWYYQTDRGALLKICKGLAIFFTSLG